MPEAQFQVQVQGQVNLAKLRQDIDKYFNESEVKSLCFDRGIDYENLSGPSKGDKVRELVAYCVRHGRMNELLQSCYTLRPHVTWWDTPEKVSMGRALLRRVVLHSFQFWFASAVGVLLLGFLLARPVQTFLSPSIESLSSRIFAWGGDFDSDPTTGGSSNIAINLIEQAASYEVSYSLPKENNAWTGMSFVLSPQNKDLTSYRAMELTLDLGTGTGCILSIMDDKGSKNDIPLGSTTPPSNDIIVITTEQSQRITIPLATNFRSVNRKSVKEIAFQVDANFPRGSYKFVVGNIKLLK